MSQGNRKESVSTEFDQTSDQQGRDDGWKPNDEQRQSEDGLYQNQSENNANSLRNNKPDHPRQSNSTSLRDSEADHRRQSNATSQGESNIDYRRESNTSETGVRGDNENSGQDSEPASNQDTLHPAEKQGGEHMQQAADYQQVRKESLWGVETQWEESRQWEQFQQETYSSGAAPRGEQPIVSMTVSLQPDSYSSMQYSSADQMSATQNRDADGGYDTNSLSTHRSIFILLLLMLPERIQPLTRTNA